MMKGTGRVTGGDALSSVWIRARDTEVLQSPQSLKLLPAWLWALRRSLSGAGDRG